MQLKKERCMRGHEDVKLALPWVVIKTFRKLRLLLEENLGDNSRTRNTTVGWYRAYINLEIPSTCVRCFDDTSNTVQQLCLCTNLCQTAVLPRSAPIIIFNVDTSQYLLLFYLFKQKLLAFTAWFQMKCVGFVGVLMTKSKWMSPLISTHRCIFLLVSADVPSSKGMSLHFLEFNLFTFLEMPNPTAHQLLRICKMDTW